MIFCDTYNAVHNGGSMTIVDASGTRKESSSVDKVMTSTTANKENCFAWTFTTAYENVYLGYINYTGTVPYYIYGIKIVRANTYEALTMDLTTLTSDTGYLFNSKAAVEGAITNDALTGVDYCYNETLDAMEIDAWGAKTAERVLKFNFATELKAGDKFAIEYMAPLAGASFQVNGTYVQDLSASSAFRTAYINVKNAEHTGENSYVQLKVHGKGIIYIKSIRLKVATPTEA